jgi:hypothetical protein
VVGATLDEIDPREDIELENRAGRTRSATGAAL